MMHGGGLQRATACLFVTVERCRFALGMDMELQEIGAAFGLDWMRLWSLNSDILHPDYVVFADQVLWVGHVFRAVGGETMEELAGRMGMEVKQLQMLNNDLTPGVALTSGQLVCLVPNSCRGAAGSVYDTDAFKDPSSFALDFADSMPVPGALAPQLMQSASNP